MTAQRIIRMGNPALERRAVEVDDPTSDEMKVLVADMIDSMNDAEGVGLAAPQIGVSLRVVVFCTPPEPSEEGDDEGEAEADIEGEGSPGAPGDPRRELIRAQPLTILFNPEIEVVDAEKEVGIEGCLSLPGLCGPVARYRGIRYTGTGADGERIDRTVDGFHARVVQHECDHLDGILYPMRMDDISRLAYVDEIELLNETAPQSSDEEQPVEVEA